MKRMSKELAAMLETDRTGPIKPRNRFDDQGRSVIECDTKRQLALYFRANRILAKAGFFAPKVQSDEVVDATMIGTHGLRPVWHGRA